MLEQPQPADRNGTEIAPSSMVCREPDVPGRNWGANEPKSRPESLRCERKETVGDKAEPSKNQKELSILLTHSSL
jgi:hypothetical protein